MRTAPIPGWDGYWITDDGRVLSGYGRGWKRGSPFRNPPVERALSLNHQGRPVVTLHIGERRQTFAVNGLVARAFIGPRPDGMECSHLNGDPTDNRVENLCWETARENTARKMIHGTENVGERNGNAVLRRVQVLAIRRIAELGVPQCLIAQAVGVGDGHISRIVNLQIRKDG